MDFYVDNNGRIANEFYRIDEGGNLNKVESGIKPLKERTEVEKAFR